MIPKTEKAFETEGKRGRLQDLLLTYETLKTKKDPEGLRKTTQYALDMGEELLKLKGNTEVGGFVKKVELMNISRSSAQDYMRAFKKLGAYREAVKNLGAGKLYVLMYLKDTDIKTLMEGGAVYGITLTEITGMSVGKLKSVFKGCNRLPRPITWHKRISSFAKHMRLAFSALAGGTK